MQAAAALTEGTLFNYLKSYATTLEVQLMIDESLKKVESRLRPAGTGRAEQSSPVSPARRELDAAWLETLVRSRVEEEVARVVPALVGDEVKRQLAARVPPRPPLLPSAATSPPRRSFVDATSETAVAETSEASPGLPRELTFAPTTDSSSSSAASSSPSSEADEAPDAGQAQRERILSAVRDVEHRMSALQRQLNEIAHAQRTAHQRADRLCAALRREPAGDSRALLTALDTDDLPRARAVVSHALRALLADAPPQKGSPPATAGAAVAARTASRSPPPDDVESIAGDASAVSSTPQRRSQASQGESPSPRAASAERSVCVSTNIALAAAQQPYRQPVFFINTPGRGTTPVSTASRHPGATATAAAAAQAPFTVSLGVHAVDIPAGVLPAHLGAQRGVRVVSVVTGGPAERVGLLPGDVLLAARGFGKLGGCSQLREALAAGATVLDVYRLKSGESFTVCVETGNH